MPNTEKRVVDSFICENESLYLLTESAETYNLFKISLKKLKNAQNQENQQVNLKQVTDFSFKKDQYSGHIMDLHIRAGSDKKSQMQNLKTFVFLIIGTNLLYWVEGQITKNLKKISDTSSLHFEALNDHTVIVSV